jgi:FlaG/FlaF family flagellin (archaellin)
MIGGCETHSDGRAITPIIAVVALIAVSVTLAAVLGAWMLGDYATSSRDVNAQVEVTYESGSVFVHWTGEGNAERITVVVGTETANIEQVQGVVEIPATAEQTVVVVAEDDSGRESVITRAQLSDV